METLNPHRQVYFDKQGELFGEDREGGREQGEVQEWKEGEGGGLVMRGNEQVWDESVLSVSIGSSSPVAKSTRSNKSPRSLTASVSVRASKIGMETLRDLHPVMRRSLGKSPHPRHTVKHAQSTEEWDA
jgi:hypothetical protein